MSTRNELTLKPIAHIKTDFPTKFGVPRQSGLSPSLRGEIVFEETYRDRNAFRGIEEYSHLWLIWGFSERRSIPGEKWSPTVKPPRLGGNTRMGVFATRSPNRPNPLGLSSVALVSVEQREDVGTVLIVAGADLMDGTPIYDIKPYLSFTDSHPGAKNGFADAHKDDTVPVEFPEELLNKIPSEKRAGLLETLGQDPRPPYSEDDETPYGIAYGGFDVRFTVKDGVLTVFDVVAASKELAHVKE